MSTVRPFRAIRPRPDLAAEVASRPYDVLSTEEARSEAAGNPLSFLHVGKPEIDFPPGTDPHGQEVYRRAAANFDRLLQEGVLLRDAEPSLYVYGLTMGSHRQYGIAGCVSVEEYRSGTVRKHELTRPDKEDDRTRHILAVGAQTGPIFLTYRRVAAIDRAVMKAVSASPVCDFFAGDGIRHQLWTIDETTTVERIVKLFREVPVLYIADGHHRSAAAARAAERGTGEADEGAFFLGVIFPHNQVQILPYNRLVRDLNGLTPQQLIAETGQQFRVKKSGRRVNPSRKGEFGMFLSGQWYTLTAEHAVTPEEDPVERLDVTILQKRILAPLLGIEDQRTSTRIDFVGGIRGTGELERRVNTGEMAVAFSLYATSVDELLAVADAHRIMPPKTTWFEPKLRDGLLSHGIGRGAEESS